MNRKFLAGLIAVAVIGAVIIGGTAVTFADNEAEKPKENGEEYRYSRGPIASGPRDSDNDGIPNGLDNDYERPADGSNSPWLSNDGRLARFQERFNLSDNQMTQLRERVQSMFENYITPAKIRETVRAQLESWGIKDPELGRQNPHGPEAIRQRGDGQPREMRDGDHKRLHNCESHQQERQRGYRGR